MTGTPRPAAGRALDAASRPWWGRVIGSPANALFLLAAGIGSVAAGSWVPLVLAAAAQALWLALFAKSRRERRYTAWLAEREASDGVRQGRHERLAALGVGARERYLEMERLREDVRLAGQEGTGVASSLLGREIAEFEGLVDQCLELAFHAERLMLFAQDTDLAALEAEITRHEPVAESAELDEATAELLPTRRFRRDKALEVRQRLRSTRTQQALLEETLRALRDQIVTMDSPEAITGRIEALRGAIEVAERSAREAESLVAGPSRSVALLRAGAGTSR